jgi:N-acyl-D-aspartate/D-glutamate deacylase
MLDLVIRRGIVFDGLGTPARRADIAVRDGRIVDIAPAIQALARETVDANGLWVTPGFIDIHTHYDLEVEIAPGLSESVRHGVTTVVMGNCSLSLTVGHPETLADMFLRVETLPRILVQKWLRQSVSWLSPAAYIRHLRELNLGPNVAALLGHSPLRVEAMGLQRSLGSLATAAELEAMRRRAVEALEAGCLGISVDMLPWHMMSGTYRGRPIPSHHASYHEYRLLAEVCREADAVFQVSPNPQNLASLWHILRLSAAVGRRPLRVTVLAALDSASAPGLWRVLPPLLTGLNRGLNCNIRFQTLPQAFTVYSDGPVTPLFEEFPSGVCLNDAESRVERERLWRSPEFRSAFARDWTGGWRKTFHRDLARMTVVRCPDEKLEGQTFAEVARARGAHPVDTLMDLLATHDTELRWVATGANERLRPRLALMRHPFIFPGFSDAGAHVRNLGYYDGALSLLKQAASTGFLTPEQAVCRVTGEPARWFRLDAGVLVVGAKADLVLLRPDRLQVPVSEQLEIADPLLDGAMRIVKRGSEDLIHSVFLRGQRAWGHGRAMAVLGHKPLGEVLSRTVIAREPTRTGTLADRINEEIEDHPFTDYWPVFVLKHQHPANVALHMLGVIIFYGLAGVAFLTGSVWWLGLLSTSQLVGLLGHCMFERSHIDWRDAVFSIRASRCLNKMFLQVLLGRYGTDVRRAREELEVYQRHRAELGLVPARVVAGCHQTRPSLRARDAY